MTMMTKKADGNEYKDDVGENEKGKRWDIILR